MLRLMIRWSYHLLDWVIPTCEPDQLRVLRMSDIIRMRACVARPNSFLKKKTSPFHGVWGSMPRTLGGFLQIFS